MGLVILPHFYPVYNKWLLKQEDVFTFSIIFMLGENDEPTGSLSELHNKLAKKYRCIDDADRQELAEFVIGCMKGMGEFIASPNYDEYIGNSGNMLSYMIDGIIKRKGVKGLRQFTGECKELLAFLSENFGGRLAEIPLTAQVEGTEEMDNYAKLCKKVLELSGRLYNELSSESTDAAEHKKNVYLLGMNIMILAHAAKSVRG